MDAVDSWIPTPDRMADKPFLIEVIVEQGDLVEPMVAAGAAVDDFVKINRCR